MSHIPRRLPRSTVVAATLAVLAVMVSCNPKDDPAASASSMQQNDGEPKLDTLAGDGGAWGEASSGIRCRILIAQWLHVPDADQGYHWRLYVKGEIQNVGAADQRVVLRPDLEEGAVPYVDLEMLMADEWKSIWDGINLGDRWKDELVLSPGEQATVDFTLRGDLIPKSASTPVRLCLLGREHLQDGNEPPVWTGRVCSSRRLPVSSGSK